MDFSDSLVSELEAKEKGIRDAISNGENFSLGIWTYFSESEDQLIDLMASNQPLPGSPGNIEFSWVLYVLNNKLPDSLKWIVELLQVPSSKITPSDWDTWMHTLTKEGVVYGDGSLISTAKYAILDTGWILALVKYIELELHIIDYYKPFPSTPANVSITGQDTLKVALFGDWGVGNYTDGNLPDSPAIMIMNQIKAMAPDMSIHLGDVYYAGTSDEEQDRLVDVWNPSPKGNFTLNSNHEMYDGANGLIKTALGSPAFKDQQGTTYFKIEFGNWVIFGLDSAYFTKSKLFMDGALTDPGQLDFIKAAELEGKRVMLFTHHNPIPEIGRGEALPLLKQVTDAVTPDYWYWGHIHNGIVYNSPDLLGDIKGRCLGNAAIPMGGASWFKNNPNIAYYTDTPLPNPTPDQANRVTNGFAILEFSQNGVTETWYDQNGTQLWEAVDNPS